MICCWIDSLTSQTRIFQLYILRTCAGRLKLHCVVVELVASCHNQRYFNYSSCFSDQPEKYKTWYFDVEILFPVKFRWIPFSGFRGEVEKCLNQSEVRAAILFFRLAQKHKLGRGRWDLASWQFSFNQFRSAVSGERSKMFQPIRGQGGHFCFSDQPEKHILCTEHWDLASCQVSFNSFQRFQRSLKKPQPIRGQGGHLVFMIRQKNTNLVEERDLASCQISLNSSGFRGEIENDWTNQRPGWPCCFSDRPEKHNLGRGHCDLASCQVSLNTVQWFQRRSRKCLSESEGQGGHLVFSDRPGKTQNLAERLCFLLSFVGFCYAVIEKKSKMSQPIREPGRPFCFSHPREKHKLGRGR